MAFVPGTNVLQIEFRMRLGGQRVENIVYAAGSTPWNTGLAIPLLTDLAGWWNTSLSVGLSDQLTLVEVFATDLTSQTAPTYSFPVTPPSAGDDTSPPLPNNVALCVSFRTAGRGRSARGRNYICGLTEADVVGNTVETALATSLITAYSAMQSIIASHNDASWVVFSRFLNGVPRVVGLPQVVTAIVIVDSIVDSQRRRLPGRGL